MTRLGEEKTLCKPRTIWGCLSTFNTKSTAGQTSLTSGVCPAITTGKSIPLDVSTSPNFMVKAVWFFSAFSNLWNWQSISHNRLPRPLFKSRSRFSSRLASFFTWTNNLHQLEVELSPNRSIFFWQKPKIIAFQCTARVQAMVERQISFGLAKWMFPVLNRTA